MRGIACTIERVDRQISINTADRDGVRLMKHEKKGRSGVVPLRR